MEVAETYYSGEEVAETRRAPSYALSGRRSPASSPADIWQAIARSTAVSAAASAAASTGAAPGRESEVEVDALDVGGCVTNWEVAVD